MLSKLTAHPLLPHLVMLVLITQLQWPRVYQILVIELGEPTAGPRPLLLENLLIHVLLLRGHSHVASVGELLVFEHLAQALRLLS